MCLTIREAGGGGAEREGTGVKWATHPNRIINIILKDFLNLLLFWFPLFDTLKSVIHYFQFVNFMHVFQPCYSLSVHSAKLEYLV